MRKIFLTGALIMGFASAGALLPSSADAMTISTPAAVQDAVGTISENVAYVCHRVRRCGYWGCGWRRSCYWRPSYSYRHYHRYSHRPYHRYGYRNGYRYY